MTRILWLRLSLLAAAALLVSGCGGGGNGNGNVDAGPQNVEEALAVLDEDYDYAAVFDNSGRGGGI